MGFAGRPISIESIAACRRVVGIWRQPPGISRSSGGFLGGRHGDVDKPAFRDSLGLATRLGVHHAHAQSAVHQQCVRIDVARFVRDQEQAGVGAAQAAGARAQRLCGVIGLIAQRGDRALDLCLDLRCHIGRAIDHARGAADRHAGQGGDVPDADLLVRHIAPSIARKYIATPSIEGAQETRYSITKPPDAPNVWPVTNNARSEARNATTPDTSSGRHRRPSPLAIG